MNVLSKMLAHPWPLASNGKKYLSRIVNLHIPTQRVRETHTDRDTDKDI